MKACWRGKYSNDKTYARYDVVMFEHSKHGLGSFICYPRYPCPEALNSDFRCWGISPEDGDVWSPYAIRGQTKSEIWTSSPSLDGKIVKFYDKDGNLEGTYMLSEMPIKGSIVEINGHKVEAK